MGSEMCIRDRYTWSNETPGREEEEGITEGKMVKAEGGKAEEGEGKFSKTPIASYHLLVMAPP